MTILKERGFTEGPVDALARQSFAGMAHFAGTGKGDRCMQCVHWDRENVRLGAAKCWKYQRLTNKPGAAVPGEASSCKYFERRPA